MSSRSKEKVAAVLRKIFKGSDKVADASSNNENKNNAASTTTKPTEAVINPKSNNDDESKQNVDSPGKRMKREDSKQTLDKITTRSTSNKAHNENWCRPSSAVDCTIRARRLMKEYKEMQRVQRAKKQPEFTVELVNDNLFEWYAQLHVLDPDSKLAKDMVELNIPYILLHLVFPDNFPFAPPFMRVVEPRIEKGFVMDGGAICMELLTPRGWASAYTVEAVLMQFSASLVKGQGRIERKSKGNRDFTM